MSPQDIKHLFVSLGSQNKPIRTYKPPRHSEGHLGREFIHEIIDVKFLGLIKEIYVNMPDTEPTEPESDNDQANGGAKKHKPGTLKSEFIYHAWQAYAIALAAFNESFVLPAEYMTDRKTLRRLAEKVIQSLDH